MFSDKKQKVVKKSDDKFKIVYGFLDRVDNKSLFINLTSWVEIISDEDKNFTKDFDLIHKKIKQELHSSLANTSYSNSKYLVDVNIRRNGLTKVQKSYLEIEMTLFTKKDTIPMDQETCDFIESLIQDIIDKNLNNKNFKFSVTKNKSPY